MEEKVVDELKRTDSCLVRRLVLKTGGKISLRRHLHRMVRFTVVAGVGRAVIEGSELILRKGDFACVECGDIYELKNTGKISLEIIEICLGEYLGEDDCEVVGAGADMLNEEFCVGPEC